MCITPFIISVIYNTEHFELLRFRCVYNAVRTFCYRYILYLFFISTVPLSLYHLIEFLFFEAKIFLYHILYLYNISQLVQTKLVLSRVVLPL